MEFTGTTRFQILRLVGSGGMGLVYEALDRVLNTRVAVKRLLDVSPPALSRFKSEFRSLADVAHPNLVPLYELLNDRDEWFFTMAFVQGVNFLQYLSPGVAETADEAAARRGQPTVRWAAAGDAAPIPSPACLPALGEQAEERLRQVLPQIAWGLDALHRHGKLHCDIKPSNLIVTPEGRTVLLDFGLVTTLEEDGGARRAYAHAGTLAYMSPEQMDGRTLTENTDWYSLGVMLYEALAGRLPFEGSIKAVIDQKRLQRFPPPSAYRPGTPGDLEELCVRLLSPDPVRRPGVREILGRLGAASATVPAGTTGYARPVFVGRKQELATLEEALNTVRQGHPAAVIISGEPGSGKSTLVENFLRPLRAQGNLVASGRCREQESIPFKAVDSPIEALSNYLRSEPPEQILKYLPRDIDALMKVFPSFRTVRPLAEAGGRHADPQDQQGLRRWAFQAFRELLVRVSDHRTIVFSIDDAQWGDLDSAKLVAELLSSHDRPSLLLIVAQRRAAYSADSFLGVLEASNALKTIPLWRIGLRPLDREAAVELARTILDDDRSGRPEAIAAESEGNPYFVQELASYMMSEPPTEARTRPSSLSSLIAQKIERLTPEARTLVEIVSVCGRPISQAGALQAAGLQGVDCGFIRSLRAGRLLASVDASGDLLEIYHDRVRETITSRLSPERLRENHLRLAEAASGAGKPDHEYLAVHFEAGGRPELAAAYYASAAEEASQATAFDHACDLFRRALSLNASDSTQAVVLRVRLAECCASAGRCAEAAHLFEQAASESEGPGKVEFTRKAGYHFAISGHVEDAIIQFRKIIAQTGLHYPRGQAEALAALLVTRSRLLLRGLRFSPRTAEQVAPELLDRIDTAQALTGGFGLIDVIRALYYNARSLELALRAGEPHRLVYSLALEASAQAVRSAAGERRSERILELCRSLAQEFPQPRSAAMVCLAEGLIGFGTGQWLRAIRCFEQAEVTICSQCTAMNWELATVRYASLLSQLNAGRYTAVAQRLPEFLRGAQDRGDLYLLNSLRAYAAPVTELAADRPDDADGLIAQVEAWRPDQMYLQHAVAFMSRVMTLLYRGDYTGAWSFAECRWKMLRRSIILFGSNSHVFCLLGKTNAALAAASVSVSPLRSSLLRQARADCRRIAGLHPRFSRPMATACRSVIASLEGDQSCLRLIGEAADQFEQLDMPVFAAAARMRQGFLLGGDRGALMVRQAENAMADAGIARPRRFAGALLGGAEISG